MVTFIFVRDVIGNGNNAITRIFMKGGTGYVTANKILVPTDFSDYSDKALKQALDIAKQYNAKVFLFMRSPQR